MPIWCVAIIFFPYLGFYFLIRLMVVDINQNTAEDYKAAADNLAGVNRLLQKKKNHYRYKKRGKIV